MNNIFQNEVYAVLITMISIILVVYSIYQRIKYLCLEKASEMVARAEGLENLSGEEKFAIVLFWINESFPKIFKNSLFKSIFEKIIQYAYDTSVKYMKKYIKRKTGQDISEILELIKNKDNNP